MNSSQQTEGLSLGQPVRLPEQLGAPQPMVLKGLHVSLAPIDASRDAPELYMRSHGNAEKERVWHYLFNGPFDSAEAMQKNYLAPCEASKEPLFFVVSELATNHKVGVVSYLNIAPADLRVELGHIWYAAEAQHTLINTETIYLMLCHVFDELKYRRVEWKCNALNARSRAAAQRLGFSFEGIFYQHLVIKGHNRDTAWFAMLDRDWPAIKRHMQGYLYQQSVASLRDANRPLLRCLDPGDAMQAIESV